MSQGNVRDQQELASVRVPCGVVRATGKCLAPRLDTLQGKVVGVLSNGKPHGLTLLRHVGSLLVERYGVQECFVAEKPSPGKPAPLEAMAGLVQKCDAILTGLGD